MPYGAKIYYQAPLAIGKCKVLSSETQVGNIVGFFLKLTLMQVRLHARPSQLGQLEPAQKSVVVCNDTKNGKMSKS